jgi:diadenosine tetraphosphatase ApaH/serine/threonine PP2A family protein phosphatase
MKYAILGDIHANLEALLAVLADARKRGVTHYLCLGDVVGYNANPVECLERVRELGGPVVRGNHDHYCAFDESLEGFHPIAADVVAWTRNQLSAEQREFLGALPFIKRVETFTIVHSTLDTPDMWGYVFDKLEADASFAYQSTTLCFYGHTHVPLAFEKTDRVRVGLYSKIKVMLGRKYLINAGSVGQPRDGDPRAAYVTFDLLKNEIELHRVPYDFRMTQKKIMAAGLPERVASRLAIGR